MPSDTISTWLRERVAFYVECEPAEIDPDVKLVEIGLDSVFAMSLSGDIEDEFGVLVEPTVAWDHPTVNALAGYLRGVVT
ncbi:Acyl carrier protein [[Actinomadura] parvosata subsp. kistnae]|uniref:Polyketide synthase n=2 Tax=Nonomuraea TaxID=83681 RepID=A0A1V0AC98_9ACTN|nr:MULTISPECIES: acyl carrier protein [unclassified Nonomuraea]AQZ67813.1 polyketide synthase [Nonomuraea sp. ATCC 55076]NJP96359.1 acyl carrier protein [Nonomuraea sp. FMUSA5-5]SPL93870.1 Acyl carrier protein [Actinomadura parvosata subsp. kistnae]